MSAIESRLEITSSARVLRERQRVALAEAPSRAVLGRHFLTLRGLAEACAGETGEVLRGELDDAARARIVRHAAEGLPPFGLLLGERPGTTHALAETLRDLRDAGIAPAALAAHTPLQTLYKRVEDRLAALEKQGLYDRVGRFRLARRGAPAWLERMRIAEISVHGATELVGSAGDLIQSVHEVIPVRFFQPDCGDAYAANLRATWPWSYTPVPTPLCAQPAISAGGARIERLPDPRSELEFVAREILHLLENGAEPASILVVARQLESYAPWLPTVLERYGIPFTSSLRESVLRRPAARVRLNLVRALVNDLEPEPLLALLHSPRFRWPADPGAPELSERLARRGRVLRSLSDWQRTLREAPALLREERCAISRRDLRCLEQTLQELDRERQRLAGASTWSAHVDGLRQIENRWLGPPESEKDAAADELVTRTLASLRRLDAIDQASGAPGAVSNEEFLTTLESSLARSAQRPYQLDNGGVRVLDALQARAVRCEHLLLIGTNHENWPYELRDDPFLPGAAREALRKQTGRPLPVPRLQEAESRFLLHLLLSQAQRSVTLCWHERDAAGRERAASVYLPELGLELAETPTLTDPAWLAPGEALTEAARVLGDAPDEKPLAELAAQLQPDTRDAFLQGRRLVRTTEAWRSEQLEYDGCVSARDLNPERTLRPTLVEGLGRCPLRGFFSGFLNVPELQAPPPYALDAREAGTLVHQVLQQVYESLFAGGALAAGGSATTALRQARELLPRAIAAAAGSFRDRLQHLHPTLWEALETQVRRACEAFLARDLAELLPDGVQTLRTETPLQFERKDLRVKGQADRILELAPGTFRVGDYKTTWRISDHTSKTKVERGERLQIPLYALAVAQQEDARAVEAEVLAVPLRPERVRDPRTTRPRPLALDEVERLSAAPLDALTGLLGSGSFPFRKDAQHCRHCPYTLACRKDHAPSEERVRNAASFSAYFALHPEAK